MKQNRTFLNWLLLLLTVGVTSCDELTDPVFASEDNPAPGGQANGETKGLYNKTANNPHFPCSFQE